MDRRYAVHDHNPHHGQGMAESFGLGFVKLAEPISGLVDAFDHDVDLFSDNDITPCRGLCHAADQLIGFTHGVPP